MSTVAPAGTSSVIRVSVISEGRRLDVGIPSQVPLIELLPGFARTLGLLDPSLTHGGYALQRADGSTLDPSATGGQQGVHDGDLLTLARGVHLVQPKVYDDIVETVIDVTGAQNRPWTARDHARTALAVSLALVGLCALVLVLAGGSTLATIIAGGASLLLAVTAIVLSRLAQHEASVGIGLASAALAAVGGFSLGSSFASGVWGWPLTLAGAAAAVIGVLLTVFSTPREPHLIPLVAGVAIAVPAVVVAVFGVAPATATAILIAAGGALTGLIPWLALSSTRIKVITPMTDLEIFDTPAPIDGEGVARRVIFGQRVALSVRIGLAVALLAATPVVAAAGPWGAALAALAFAGMMFPSRQTYSRIGVLVIMVIGAVGLIVTSVTVALTQPALHPALLTVLLVAAAVLVTLTLLSPKARMAVTRFADVAEVVIIASLPPLGIIVAGLT